MFDVAFSELVVIAIVALIVIGPEKLPKVARTVGSLLGRMQRYVNTVKADIDRELQFEDLQKIQQEIKQAKSTVSAEMNSIENSIGDTLADAKKPDSDSSH